MTREQAEAVIIRRLKKLMLAVGMSTNPTGDNADLDDPFYTALLAMDIDADMPPVSADVVAVATSDVSELLVRAQIQVLRNILGNIEGTDISMSTGKTENRSQLVDQVRQMLVDFQAQLSEITGGSNTTGGGSGILVGGTLALDFQSDYTDDA